MSDDRVAKAEGWASGNNWEHTFHYKYSPTDFSKDEQAAMSGIINKFANYFMGFSYRNPRNGKYYLTGLGKKHDAYTSYGLWVQYENAGPALLATIKGLQDFYKKVQNKATDITEEIWNDYQKTGCYYTDSEMTINGKKVRYALEVTYDAVLAWPIT